MPEGHVLSYIDPARLNPNPNNPRLHSKKQIKQIANSLKEFGFVAPILVRDDLQIVAGHGRAEAAISCGLKLVPIVSVSHLSPQKARAYLIADNKLAENAAWDTELLALELRELESAAFDITILGFEGAEIDAFFSKGTKYCEDGEFEPDVRDAPVSRRGDLWRIGPHRLLCGDALSMADVDRLMGNAQAQCVFTDPPYNVPINGHVSGKGKNQHREFVAASGELSRDAFTDFLALAFRNLARHSANGSIHFICMDWRHISELLAAATPVYGELKNLCVWAKSNGGMGSLYRSRHELIFVFKNGTDPHINNVELGKFGRNRTNVWEYPGVNSFGAERDSELAMHPTVKPVAMVADALLDCSQRNSLILDPFSGSGTTFVAAQKIGRRAYGLELDPRYVDVILRRLKSVYDLDATLVGENLTFEDVRRARIPSKTVSSTVYIPSAQETTDVTDVA